MVKDTTTEYETFLEVMDELLRPISAEGLEVDTLKRLYESKLVYLENLRVKCFRDINHPRGSRFTVDDYGLILDAVHVTQRHLREILLYAISINLSRRNAS